MWDDLPGRRDRLGLSVHRLGWSLQDIRAFVAGTLRSGGGTWVSGIHGALAEFCVGDGEEAALGLDGPVVTAVTERGAIAFHLSDRVRALAFGTDVIVLALPRVDVPEAAPLGLTALGADRDAIRADARGDALFDFGLGGRACQFGVRTAVPDLIDGLGRCVGLRWPALLASVGADLVALSPTRVVRHSIGRIEVATPIPPPGGLSPPGPHTHFLPDLLALGGDLPPSLALPKGLVPCAAHYRRRPE